MSNNSNKHVPKDAQVIMSILKDMGVNEYEPQVIHQLLEFTYRYVTGVLEDARAYASHANKKVIDVEDVQLAVQMLMDKSFTTPPPRDMLLNLARAKNSVPLPPIKPHCGVRLPPDRFCMTSCNFELKSIKKPTPNIKPTASFSSGGTSLIKTQIKPTVKRTLQTFPKTQSVTIPTKKPVLKITPAVTVVSDDSTWKQKMSLSAPNQPLIQTVMEIDEPPASLIKKKLDD